jgi:predicted TPR repeat methyltransferase
MGKREKEKAAARAAALVLKGSDGEPARVNAPSAPSAIAPGQTAPGRVAVGMAAQLMEAGQLELAESTCRAVLASSPSDPDALHLLGVVLGQRGAIADAVKPLERAVTLAPGNPSAWLNLGILLIDSAPSRAEACFRNVLQIAPDSVPARGNLATVLEKAGRLSEAEHELTLLLKANPNDTAALRLLAKVSRLGRKFESEVRALRTLLALQATDEKLPGVLGRAYFLWYDSVDTDIDKSLEVLTEWLAFAPEDPVARHMHASRAGGAVPERASAEYVEHHFDEFAASFDTVLTKLEYRAPEIVRDLLAKAVPEPAQNLDIVDIGCGTGRLGPLIVGWKKNLIGVDLSQKMLDRAEELKVYESLCHADVTSFLAERHETYDIAVCVDTLVYFGDLTALFGVTHDALRSGAWFLGTIEELDADAAEEAFKLHHGGRYAHKKAYLRAALERAGFAAPEITQVVLRLEFQKPVHGLAFAARRA